MYQAALLAHGGRWKTRSKKVRPMLPYSLHLLTHKKFRLRVVPTEPQDEHETYIVAPPTIDPEEVFKSSKKGQTDPTPGRIVTTMSTDNLLLNGYRAMRHGMPLQVLMDCAYSMTTDGLATLLIGVYAPDQVFHVVSYSILNHEDKIGHDIAIRATKKAVETTVAKYQNGLV